MGLALALGTGCAQMGTRQTDTNTTTRYEISPEGTTNAITSEVRETTTRSSGKAIFAASSTFEGLDASQDGQSQGLKVDKSSQKSDADKLFNLFQTATQLAGRMYGVPLPPAQPAATTPAPSTAPGVPLQAPPPGMKWTLAPKDDPSTPQTE